LYRVDLLSEERSSTKLQAKRAGASRAAGAATRLDRWYWDIRGDDGGFELHSLHARRNVHDCHFVRHDDSRESGRGGSKGGGGIFIFVIVTRLSENRHFGKMQKRLSSHKVQKRPAASV